MQALPLHILQVPRHASLHLRMLVSHTACALACSRTRQMPRRTRLGRELSSRSRPRAVVSWPVAPVGQVFAPFAYACCAHVCVFCVFISVVLHIGHLLSKMLALDCDCNMHTHTCVYWTQGGLRVVQFSNPPPSRRQLQILPSSLTHNFMTGLAPLNPPPSPPPCLVSVSALHRMDS